MLLMRFLVFAAAAKHLNTTRAAEELGISQPAVRQHLRLLEETYHAKLYRRKGRGITLTEAGTDFLRRVTPILSSVEKFNQIFRPVTKTPKVRPLTVGVSYGPSVSLLPSILTRLKKRNPPLRFALKTSSSTAIERLVLNGKVEIAVVSRPAHRRLVSEPFCKAKLVVFAPKHHPFARKAAVKLTDFLQARLVLRRGNDRRSPSSRLVALLRSRGLNPRVAMRSDSIEAVKNAVTRKMGVGILYEDVVAPDVRNGQFQVLKVSGLKRMEGQSYIIYPKGALSESAQAFLSLLRKYRRQPSPLSSNGGNG